MVVVSYSGKEINAKIVYYGPGLCGKTTNLERIYESVPAGSKGKMISMKTKADRTLFFDFLPIELGEISGFRTRFMLYTVPGQVYYNATRKLVLKGADAVVFVADSERGKMAENQASLENLRENLESYGVNLSEVPLVFQYNKRDLPDVYTAEELDQGLGRGDRPMTVAVAATGEGVFETLRLVSELLLSRLRVKLGGTAPAAAGKAGKAKPQAQAPAESMVIPVAELDSLRAAKSGQEPAGTPASRLQGASKASARANDGVEPRRAEPQGRAEPEMLEPLAEAPSAYREARNEETLPGLERTTMPVAESGPAARRGAPAPPAGAERPPLEVLHLQSASDAPGRGHSELGGAHGPSPTDARRIVVPVKIDLSEVRDGEVVELVIRLEIEGSTTANQRISR